MELLVVRFCGALEILLDRNFVQRDVSVGVPTQGIELVVKSDQVVPGVVGMVLMHLRVKQDRVPDKVLNTGKTVKNMSELVSEAGQFV